ESDPPRLRPPARCSVWHGRCFTLRVGRDTRHGVGSTCRSGLGNPRHAARSHLSCRAGGGCNAQSTARLATGTTRPSPHHRTTRNRVHPEAAGSVQPVWAEPGTVDETFDAMADGNADRAEQESWQSAFAGS